MDIYVASAFAKDGRGGNKAMFEYRKNGRLIVSTVY